MAKIDQVFIDAAIKSDKDYGVPASISLAQGILESGWFKHTLGDAHNPFGIKYNPKLTDAGFVEVATKEDTKSGIVTIKAKFCKFRDFNHAFEAHAKLIANNPVYKKAMANKDNPDEFARCLTGVYATDRKYHEKLIKIMKQENLYQYDIK